MAPYFHRPTKLYRPFKGVLEIDFSSFTLQLIKKAFSSEGALYFGARFKVFRYHFPESIYDMDAWFITGSPTGVYENDENPWINRLMDFIYEAHTAGVPVVGMCFGHQVIAQTLGGHVNKYPGGWALGMSSYQFWGSSGNWSHKKKIGMFAAMELVWRKQISRGAAKRKNLGADDGLDVIKDINFSILQSYRNNHFLHLTMSE